MITLGTRLSATIVVIVVMMLVVIMLAVPRQMKSLASDQSQRHLLRQAALVQAQRRADGVTTALAIAVQAGVEFDDQVAIAELLNRIGDVDDVVYGVVMSHTRELGRWQRPGTPAPTTPALLHATKTGSSLVEVNDVVHVAVDVDTKDPAQRGRLYLGFSQSALKAQLARSAATLLSFARSASTATTKPACSPKASGT